MLQDAPTITPCPADVSFSAQLRTVREARALKRRRAELLAVDPCCDTCGREVVDTLSDDNSAMLDGDTLKCRSCVHQRVKKERDKIVRHPLHGKAGRPRVFRSSDWVSRTADRNELALAVLDLERSAFCPYCGRPIDADLPACHRHLTAALSKIVRAS